VTVKLSRLKTNKIMRLYFIGRTQVEIAVKAAVDQSTVSHYATRFKEIARTQGLLGAGKEFGVENEVDALRSLAVEMANARLTTEEAKEGLKIIKAFLELGVNPEQHHNLIKVCSKINDQGFIQAAVKITEIEDSLGLSYEETVDRFEELEAKIPGLEQTKNDLNEKIRTSNQVITNAETKLTYLNKHIRDLEMEYRNKEASLKTQLSQSMKAKDIKEREIEQVAYIEGQLKEEGFDIPTFAKLLKEYTNG